MMNQQPVQQPYPQHVVYAPYPPQQYEPQQYAPQQYVQQQVQQPVVVQQVVQPIQGSLLDATFNANDRILVCQRIEPLEIIIGFEMSNKYDVHFGNGYKACAVEESSFVGRWCLGNKR